VVVDGYAAAWML
jgi:hypothetical protein